MKREHQRFPEQSAARIAVVYAIVAALWIIVSDHWARGITTDPVALLWVEIGKGWAYVLCTAALLYVLLRRSFRRLGEQQAALSTSTAQYRLLFDASPLPLWVYDLETFRFLAVNEAATKHYGYSRQEFLAMTIKDIRPQEEIPALLRSVANIADGLDQTLVNRHVKKDGTLMEVAITAHPLDFGGRRAALVLAQDVTEQRQIERRQKETNTLLQTVMNNIEEHINIVTPDGDVLWHNRAAEGSFPQVVGRKCWELFERRQQRCAHCVHPAILVDGQPRQYETELTSPAGRRTTWAVRAVPLRDDAGQIVSLLETAQDITDRKRAEAALRESEERFRVLLQHAQDGINICERVPAPETNGRRMVKRLVFGNDRFVEMSGFSLQELKDCDDISKLVVVHLTPPQQAENAKLRAAGQAYSGVSSWKRPDGKENYHEWVSVQIIMGGKQYTLGIDRDITERRRTDQQLHLQLSALQAAANAILIATRDGTIQWVNAAFTKLTGYTAVDAVGKNMDILNSKKHDGAFSKEMWDAVRAGRAWRGELTRQRRDGTLFTEEMTMTPVRDAQGSVSHLIAIKQDVTERHLFEEALRQSQRVDAIGRLAGGVAHDFNNLLTAMFGYIHALRDRRDLDAAAQSQLQELNRAAERAAGLTQQLLAFGRKQVLQPAVLELNTVVGDMEKMLRPLVGENIEFVLKLNPQAGRVRADRSQLEQVLINLVINARDAMPHHGCLTIETGAVELDAASARQHPRVSPGTYALLVVQDTGCGMTDEVQAHLFEPFYTTKELGRGTGLGLATCYGIIHQSGGHIAVASRPGQGTTMRAYLPVADAPATVTPTMAATEPPRGTETILLAEDEPVLRELARTILSDLGYRVLEAEDGVAALLLLQNQPLATLNLLVSDVVMPQMGGLELVKHVRALYPQVKVLMVSGYSPEIVAEAGTLGVSLAFLPKPYTPAGLAVKVRAVLDS